MSRRAARFDLAEGTKLADKYRIISRLGVGWEGEVYRVRELTSRVERAAKLFYPERNLSRRATRYQADKLHRLRHCPILIQYHTQETVTIDDQPISVLVSELVEGESLSGFMARQAGKRLHPFEALCLLHALAGGMACLHKAKEFHGDLHDENILVRRVGIHFQVRIFDLHDWGLTPAEAIRKDVCDLARILYDVTGGKRLYARQPQVVKQICCGLKKGLITRRFKNAGRMREHIESLSWDE